MSWNPAPAPLRIRLLPRPIRNHCQSAAADYDSCKGLSLLLPNPHLILLIFDLYDNQPNQHLRQFDIHININNNADACHVRRFVTDPLLSSRNSAGRLTLFVSTPTALTSSITSASNTGMSQETQPAALYSQQREAGSVRTALPSRPMSSKPGSPAPPSQERTRLPTGQESHDHRQRLSGSPPGSQTSPTPGTMSKQQSPGAEHSSKASPPPGHGGSQGQVCR